MKGKKKIGDTEEKENDVVYTTNMPEEDLEDENSNQVSLIKKLRGRVKKAETKAQEYLTGWQKERAEGVNLRKRAEKEKKEFVKIANENLIIEILPALDSFDVAMANFDAWNKLPNEWTKGMEYIYAQLLSALEANGVKRLYPLHQKFNPNRDEALETVKVNKKEDHEKVISVVQPGYSFNEKILRSVKVKVGEYNN